MNPVSIELRKGQDPNYQGKGYPVLDEAGGLQSHVIWPRMSFGPSPSLILAQEQKMLQLSE